MTQARLAETVDLSPDEISRIERGARDPRFDTIERLAEALGVEPQALFADRGSGDVGISGRRAARDVRIMAALRGLDPGIAEALARCARILARALADRGRHGRRRRSTRA